MITIRNEEKADYLVCENLVREAFWNLYIPGASEHLVLHKMRKSKDYLKDLSFVMLDDERIIGGIYFTKSKIVTKNKELPTITFGPLFIDEAYRGKGLAKKLISYALDKALSLGFKAVIITGRLEFYERVGFKRAKTFKISMPDLKYYQGLLARELEEAYLNDAKGYVVFSDCFEVSEAEVLEFDQYFPYKEKQVLPCQEEFLKYASLID